MVKNLPANAQDTRDEGLIPGSGRSLGVGRGNPLQYSCLGDPMDRGTWWATVHWITNSPLDHKLLDTAHLGHLHARVRTHTHIHTHMPEGHNLCLSKTQSVHIRKDESNCLIYQITEE